MGWSLHSAQIAPGCSKIVRGPARLFAVAIVLVMAGVCSIDRCGRTIDEADSIAEPRGKAVLVPTGWDAHWHTGQYFEDHQFLTRRLHETLAPAGVAGQFCTALRYSSSACGIQLCNCWIRWPCEG